MFGLAARARHIRIETRARNALNCTVSDAAGCRPLASVIAPEAPASLALRTSAQRLVVAARAAGAPAVLSGDAGGYLCNYLCWRASETTRAAGAPRLVAFVHVPALRRTHPSQSRRRQPPFSADDLIRVGEAIVLAALAAARTRR